MPKVQKLTHQFVEHVPSPLQDGVVYVSIDFATVIHKCCCGCGDKVVTPLTPTDWTVSYDGQSVSLNPSIGRWDADCRSHYWIRNDRVVWADTWSAAEVDALKEREARLRDDYFGGDQGGTAEVVGKPASRPEPRGWFRSLLKKFGRR